MIILFVRAALFYLRRSRDFHVSQSIKKESSKNDDKCEGAKNFVSSVICNFLV